MTGKIVTTYASLMAEMPVVNDRALTKDLFTEWLQYIDVRPKTVQTYTRAIKQFLLWMKDNNISRPVREDIITYRDELKEEHKPNTVQAYMAAVKQFFRWTSIKGIYPDISVHVKGAKIDRGYKKDYLTSRQAAKLLKTVDRSTQKGLRDYAVLVLMLTTGVRTIEVCRANVEDLGTLGNSTILRLQGKGRDEKNELVKVEQHAEDAIRAYLRTRKNIKADSPLFSSIANRNKDGRMTTRSLSRLVKERLADANLISERLTAHSLRHTTATLNLLAGGTPQETQQLLRHANINTTMIYSHALEREKNNSEARVASAIFG